MIIRGIRRKDIKRLKQGDVLIIHTGNGFEYYMIILNTTNKTFGYLDLNTYKVVNSLYNKNIKHETIQSVIDEVENIENNDRTMIVDRNDCILDFKTE